METTIKGCILGLYWDKGVMENGMETTIKGYVLGLYWDNGNNGK